MVHRVILTTILTIAVVAQLGLALGTRAQEATPSAAAGPSTGWDLHIDAKAHFAGDPEAIAHHFCKAVAGGMFECLLFASEAPDARLVGVEVIVDAITYERFDEGEQRLWHYHKEEVLLVNPVLPELTEAEAAEVGAMLEETYGKVYLLWDPTVGELPTGRPFVHDVHAAATGEVTPTP